MLDLHQWLLAALVWSIAYYVIVVVHETGHYLAGLLIGIPPREMKIVLSKFPQHVALREGEQWVSPLEASRYVQLAERFMPTTLKALAFVAGGFILETLFLLGWVMLRLPYHQVVIILALGMTLLYLIADVVMFLKTRQACMDFSGLFSISPLWGGLLVTMIISSQILIFMLR